MRARHAGQVGLPNKAVYFRIHGSQRPSWSKAVRGHILAEGGWWLVVNSNINPPFDDDKSHQMEDQFISSGGGIVEVLPIFSL